MPKFIGVIDVSGRDAFVIEAETEEEAREELYRLWLQACEENCDRVLRAYTPENVEKYKVTE